MTPDVVAQIEDEVKQLRAAGKVPHGLEEELDARFESVARESLDAASAAPGESLTAFRDSARSTSARLAQLPMQATMLARRRLGPSLRRLERRTVLGTARAGEAASTQAHIAADHLERLVSLSPLASRAVSTARPGEFPAPVAGGIRPNVEGTLLDWVLGRLVDAGGLQEDQEIPALVLHAECGDGRVVEALAARGLDAVGADPRRRSRATGDTNIVAAGALEYLGATPSESLGGLLITGVVDRLRPGGARALAQLAASRLAPGGVVVLVSARPEAANAIDPVAADLAPGRPLHPVTWCHLLARYGLSELAVFEPDANEPDLFAVSARRPLLARAAGKNDR